MAVIVCDATTLQLLQRIYVGSVVDAPIPSFCGNPHCNFEKYYLIKHLMFEGHCAHI